MIDRTIKNTKKNTLILCREYLQQKCQNKNTLQDFRGNTYSKNSKYKNFLFFLCLSYICRRARYKMDLISAKGYENAGVKLLKIEETDERWVSMKDVRVGLGVKSISDLVLKEIHGICKKKELTKEETKCYKMTER